MGERMHKPGYMLLLESRGIRPGGYFRAQGAFGESCFRVTRDCRLLDLDGAPAALDENSLWEQLLLTALLCAAVWKTERSPQRLSKRELNESITKFKELPKWSIKFVPTLRAKDKD